MRSGGISCVNSRIKMTGQLDQRNTQIVATQQLFCTKAMPNVQITSPNSSLSVTLFHYVRLKLIIGFHVDEAFIVIFFVNYV